MNIFYLDKCPDKAARLQYNKHVVKMILESAQMLCTAHHVYGNAEQKLNVPYKQAHLNHPPTVWLFESAYNYRWLYLHMMALNDEYKKRYNHTKNHVTIDKLGDILKHPPKNAKYNKIATEPTPANAEHCKVPGDAVASYRKYYILEKKRFATWKAPAKIPEWYRQGVKNG